MEQKLKGQVAIITGASSGIGAGVSRSMAAAGATVVINYPVPVTKDAADAVLKEVTDAGGTGITYACDVSKEDQVIKMFADVVAQFGTVDILVNNAGLQKDAKFNEMTLDQWNFVLGVNLTGQFLCAREAIKEFLRRGLDETRSKATGKIICMSSVHEVIPWAGHANYAWDTAQHLQDLLRLIPEKRIGQVKDIGNAAVFLASDDADYINGTTLFVDGGMTLYPGFEDNG